MNELRQRIHDDSNGLDYVRVGDYYIPDIALKPDSHEPLGKYGRMRRTYLEEHRPILYCNLSMQEELFPHLREVDRTARRRLEQMMAELLEKHPAPDKMSNQMGWVQHMNSMKATAEEIILHELIYV